MMKVNSKRQRVRIFLVFLSLAIFPITKFYYSPYLPVEGAFEGVVSGSLIVFGVLFIASLSLGRFWCGWICTGGGIQEVCSLIQSKPIKRRWIRYIKYPLVCNLVVHNYPDFIYW